MKSAVIDANIAVYCVIPSLPHAAALALLEKLVRQEVELYVPHLWLAEVTTAIRKLIAAHNLTPESGGMALEAALNLPVQVIPEDAGTCRRALFWADRLGQTAAYDAIYLALAESLSADLYTADRKLFNRCEDLGVDFVKILEPMGS